MAFFFGDKNQGGMVTPGLSGQTGLGVLRQTHVCSKVNHHKSKSAGSQQMFRRSGSGDIIRAPNDGHGPNINSGGGNIWRKERTIAAGDPGHRFALFLRLEHQSKHKGQGGAGRSPRYFRTPTG
jgi:hypothetical protein